MKIKATSVTFAPPAHERVQRRVMSAALRTAAELLGDLSPGLQGTVTIPGVQLSIPFPLEHVVNGQLSEASAATVVATRLFEAVRHRVPRVARQQAERRSWWRKLIDALGQQRAVAASLPESASEAESRQKQLEEHSRRIQELLSAGAFQAMGFHGSLSDMLDGLEQTGGRIISAADLEKESVQQVSGEGDAFTGKAGKKNFISIGHGDSGLGTAVAYAQAVQQLNHYNVKRYTYAELKEEIERLQLIVARYDELKITMGGPLAGFTVKSKEQFASQLHKLQLERQLRDKLPRRHPAREGGPDNAQNFPVLFEFDLSGLKVSQRHDVKPGGTLGGEASVYDQVDLRRRLVRFYAPMEQLEATRQRLAGVLGHENFEALPIEALAAIPGEGSHTGSSRVSTLGTLRQLQQNFIEIQQAFAEAAKTKAELDFTFLLERVKTMPMQMKPEPLKADPGARAVQLHLDADASAPAPVLRRKPIGLVQPSGLQGIAYAPPIRVVGHGPAARAPRAGASAFDRFKALLGLGGADVQILRPEQTPEQQAASGGFVEDFLAVEARLHAHGVLAPEDFRRLRDGLGPHLSRHGVAFVQQGSEFTIKPAPRGGQLNVLAWRAKKTLGITLSYDLRERLKPGAAVGAYSSDARALKLDTRTILTCRPSGTALHELHHAWLYKRIDKGRDSFLNLKMWNMSREQGLSSAVMYTGAMSNQELSTFAKQPRQVLSVHLRGGAVYTPTLDKDLRIYLWKLSQVALQGKEVAERLMPELKAFLEKGEAGALSFDSKDGDLEVRFRAAARGLHHRISVHTVAGEHRKAGAGKPSGQRVLAQDLLAKLTLTRDVCDLLLLQAHAVTRALDALRPGQALTADEVLILKNLTAWPGYTLRVATATDKAPAQKLAELERQRGLATSRLGIEVGASLPPLELGQSVDDDA
ncbi:MAG: hypothetical protein M9894_31025 [Planctomycetes bacterium]|nr:hypothetical protein [Planctomycetota bacterium]